jgi:hypothetical protein
MTGVMIFQYDGFPTIFGDTLLSARVPLEPFVPPSIGNIGVFSSTHQPSGLCQKIVQIATNIAYIWAGKLDDIVVMHNSLRSIASASSSEWADDVLIEKFNNYLLSCNFDESGIAVIMRKNPNLFSVLNFGMDVSNTPPFDFIITGGSGAGSFVEELMKLEFRMPENLQVVGMEKKNSDRVVRYTLLESIIQAKMLFREYENAETGGIVETILFGEDKLSKPPVTIFLVWDDYYAVNASVLFKDHPFLCIKRFYEKDILYVSFTNYAEKTKFIFGVGHPGNLDPSPPSDLNRFESQSERPERVHCIHFKNDGGRSHFIESGDMFMEHFSFSDESDILKCSDWYLNDSRITRSVSDNIKYPEW